ncbi:hypothetical protein LR68_01803 [Anoxybacillus sp. BCO1]|nr:hypothetical protein LR68_01803 [Anoxybacillus sp. BCO1]
MIKIGQLEYFGNNNEKSAMPLFVFGYSIEWLCKWLKDEVIANMLYKDQKDIAQYITRFEQYVLQPLGEVLRLICCTV